MFVVTAGQVSVLLIVRQVSPTRHRPRLAAHFRQVWARRLLRILNIRVQVSGTLPAMPCIFVANHRSYLDPAIMLAHLPCTMLSKAEVARIPIIGPGAQAVGIVFVHRERARSRAASLTEIAESLAAGTSVAVYPEGTTAHGPALLPLKGGVFSLAAERGIPIVPVALEYRRAADAWVDEVSMTRHFLHTIGTGPVLVALSIGPVFTGTDADALQQQAQMWLEAEVQVLRKILER